MSLTIIQRFYDLAKQEAEAPALGLSYNGAYHDLPWWFFKSKAKHFCLGLLDWGATRGDYFYLLPSSRPTWIYADLGALTLGLKVCTLPPQLSIVQLRKLLEQYPPAFIFWGDQTPNSWWSELNRCKKLKGWVWDQDGIERQSTAPQEASFRQIFNGGIRQESKHHPLYRKLRESIQEKDIVNPFRVEIDGTILEKALNHREVNLMATELSRACPLAKSRRLYGSLPLWWTMGRIVSLYWPIQYAIQSVIPTESADLWENLVLRKPSIAFFSQQTWDSLSPSLTALTRHYLSKIETRSFRGKTKSILERWKLKRALRKTFGKRLRHLFTPDEVDASFVQSLTSAGIQYASLRKILNFEQG